MTWYLQLLELLGVVDVRRPEPPAFVRPPSFVQPPPIVDVGRQRPRPLVRPGVSILPGDITYLRPREDRP